MTHRPTPIALVCALALLIAVLGSCKQGSDTAQAQTTRPPTAADNPPADNPLPPDPLPDARAAGYAIGEPIVHETLAVYPLYRIDDVDETDYVTLGEAAAEETVTVSELADPDVPRLHVRNDGDKPLYICGGEVLLGGKQDRICAGDVVVPPGSVKEIDVHCVEAGRWTPGAEFAASGVVARRAVRKATQNLDEESQSEVWSNVAASNESAGALGISSYRGSIESEKGQTAEEFAQAVIDAIAEDPDIAGVAVAINGRIAAADGFRNPKLFHKIWPKLAKSYAMDAVASARVAAMVREAPTPADVAEFIAQAEAGEQDVRTLSAGDSVQVYNARGVQGFGFGGGFGAAGAAAEMDHLNVLAD